MPISRRWRLIKPRSMAYIPDEPGVYEIGDRWGQVIDIGSSQNLAMRIPEKLRDSKFLGQARLFRYEIDDDPEYAEALEQAEFMARYGRKPRFTFRVQGEAHEILEDILG